MPDQAAEALAGSIDQANAHFLQFGKQIKRAAFLRRYIDAC